MSAPERYVPDDEAVRRFSAEGVLVTPPLFSDDELEAAKRAILACWEARVRALRDDHAPGAAGKAGYASVRPELVRLHLESTLLSSFCRSGALARVTTALLGPDVDMIWNQAYAKAGRGDPRTAIPWHQDAWYAQTTALTFNCWIAITHVSEDNGGLVVARRPTTTALLEHRWDEGLLFPRCEPDDEGTPITLRPGQAFIFTSDVPHRSGANLTAETRIAYAVSFSTPDVRLRANGEPFGDRVPVVRGGRLVTDLMRAHASADGGARHGGEAVLDELRARAPMRLAWLDSLWATFRDARSREDGATADAALASLLALVPDSPEVNGDLLRARGSIEQVLAELDAARRQDPSAARLLARRALELDPHNESAHEALRVLGED